MEGIGNVVAIDGNSVIISSPGAQHEYKIPKSHVEGYNGAEVILYISVTDINSFNIDSIDSNDNNNATTKEEGTTTLSTIDASSSPPSPTPTMSKSSGQAPIILGEKQQLQTKNKEMNKSLKEERVEKTPGLVSNPQQRYIEKTKKLTRICKDAYFNDFHNDTRPYSNY
jgi:hypothetical protein